MKEETDFPLRGAKVVEQLSRIFPIEPLCGFDLDDHSILDDHIHSIEGD